MAVGTPLAQQLGSAGWLSANVFTGVFFQASNTTVNQCIQGRGTSNIFLFGEKYLTTTDYYNGVDGGDNEAPYVGFDNDITRTTFELPAQDAPNASDTLRFGSAHVGGLNMAMCDGSVTFISYGIDLPTWSTMGRLFE